MARGVPAPRNRLSSHPDGYAVRRGTAAARVTFLHPLALVGLAAAAIPALLHLLERRAPPEADFPPLRYLSEAERQSARRLKLRHLLLLILRTAVIALVVLAAASTTRAINAVRRMRSSRCRSFKRRALCRSASLR